MTPVDSAAPRPGMAAGRTYARIATALTPYAFIARNEAELQDEVAQVLTGAGIPINREVIAERGQYDILVPAEAKLVIELKMKGTAAEVDRQAQRYALTADVEGVVVVTTSRRLAAQIKPGQLGGKPLWVIALRTAI